MARSFPSQMSEIHARVAVLNRFMELGLPVYPSCNLNLSCLGNSIFKGFMQQRTSKLIYGLWHPKGLIIQNIFNYGVVNFG